MSRKHATYGSLPPDEQPEMPRIPPSDEATRRACTLAGYLPHLPPTSAPFGVGAALPDRSEKRTCFSPARDS